MFVREFYRTRTSVWCRRKTPTQSPARIDASVSGSAKLSCVTVGTPESVRASEFPSSRTCTPYTCFAIVSVFHETPTASHRHVSRVSCRVVSHRTVPVSWRESERKRKQPRHTVCVYFAFAFAFYSNHLHHSQKIRACVFVYLSVCVVRVHRFVMSSAVLTSVADRIGWRAEKLPQTVHVLCAIVCGHSCAACAWMCKIRHC